MGGEIAIRSIRVGRRDTNLIPVDKITVDPSFNVRTEYGDIEGLAADIAENGLHQPLKVWVSSGSVILVDGHRRLRAIQYAREHLKAPIDAVYCLTENTGSNEETRLLEMFSTGTHTKPLTPMEQAKVFKRLIDLNWSVPKIAKQTGFGEPKVRSLLDLNGASSELRQAVVEEKISPSAAASLAKCSPEEQQRVLSGAKGSKVRVADVQRARTGKVYTMSTVKLQQYLDRTKEAVRKRKAEKRPVDFVLGMQAGLAVAMGKRKFSLQAKPS